MRPVALKRRNWIHIGSEEAGPRAAAIVSIVETCRRLKIPVRDVILCSIGSVVLTTRSAGWGPALGLMVGYFRANHATGVSSLTRFAGKFSKPGSTALRYSRTGIRSLRHVSTIEMMAATRGPACSLPTWIQLFRLWKDFHNAEHF